MSRSIRMAAAGVLLASTAIASSAAPTLAGCSINVTYDNRDSKQATVYVYDSKSLVKYGIWKKLGNGTVSVPANDDRVRSYTLDLGCNYDRRYKFRVHESGRGTKTIYKPSSSGYTRSTSLTVRIDF
jgi:hypothetical protein